MADIAIAAALLPVLSPVMALIAIAIWVTSPGPVLFRQSRVGQFGKLFTVYKFRSLAVQAPKYSEKLEDSSPHITAVGRLLRRTGLDEIPQLINVLRGEMALIGPRPEQLPLLSHYSDWQLLRHAVKPGITGWWQIHHRDGSAIYQNVEKDLFYIVNQGPRLDLQILIKTVAVLGKGAFRTTSRSRSSRKSDSITVGEQQPG